MNLFLAAAIVAAATGLAVGAMLLVRRRAPEGSFFEDGDRASGVFGVLATGFSVLLGFVVFLAFSTYDASRAGAEQEALTLVQQVETAQFFPPEAAGTLTGELVCYGRYVVHQAWPRMEEGTFGDTVNPWGLRMLRTVQGVEPRTASEQAAYGKYLDQTSEREAARLDRIHGATGVIPTPLWIVIFFTSVLIFIYMLFFADSGERAKVQALLMGAVVAVIVAMLLLLHFLDNPYNGGVGSLKPVAMERSLRILDECAAHRATRSPVAVRRSREAVNEAAGRNLLELVALLLLAVAAVATAWSSYQANRWNGEQAKTTSKVNATRIAAARASGLANAQTQVDIATFMQWVDAYAHDERRAHCVLRAALPKGIPAGLQSVGREPPAEEPGRAADAVRDAGVPARRHGGGEPARRAGRGASTARPHEHPALVELRPQRRPLFGGALLRRREHEAEHTAPACHVARARLPHLPRDARLGRDVSGQRVGVNGRSSSTPGCTIPTCDSGTSFQAPARSPSGSETTTRVSSESPASSALSG